jgi:cystinosin
MAVSFLSILSAISGWVYTLCWSLSFYPQPLLNFRRKSTTGATIDFPTINTLGFLAYFSSSAAFMYSSQIRKEYALRYGGYTPTVQFNDLAFAGHAVILCFITISQYVPWIWGFDTRTTTGHRAFPSRTILGIGVGCILGVGIVAIIVAGRNDGDPQTGWAWIDVARLNQVLLSREANGTAKVYACSYVKVLITLVKYMPQVLTNYRNHSTKGWSINQILLDFVGGILSLLQLATDSYRQGDWSGVTGNPVKLALGNISIFFDVIFISQHYFLYNKKRGKSTSVGENDPLIEDSIDEDSI